MKLTRDQIAVKRALLPYERRSPALLALGAESSSKQAELRDLENRIKSLQMQISSAQAVMEYLVGRVPKAMEAYERAFKVYLAMKKKDLEEQGK